MAEPGFAWFCSDCQRLYTTKSSVTRRDGGRCHGDSCPGIAPRRVAVDHDGWPLPGELPPGEVAVKPAFRSCWSLAATAGQQASSVAAVVASVPAPAPAPAPPVWAPVWAPAPAPEEDWRAMGYKYPPPPEYFPPPSPSPPPPPPPSPPLRHVECLKPSDVLAWQRSRQTRHQDAASRSRQGHVIDLDPTDGLPVQRWGLMKVTINQDAQTDSSSINPKSTSSAEWATQFNTEQHPWPERSRPSYIDQVQSWNQELLRKKRAGNTNPTISTYDRKTQSWISGAEQERKATSTKKLGELNTTDSTEKPRNGNDAESSKSGDESGAEDSSNEYNKSADEDEFDGDETTPFKPSTKRRKVTSRHNGSDNIRSFEVTKWVPLPPTSIDKSQDRTCLAPRRPGMPPLYSNPEYAMKIFGRYHSSSFLANTSGYDLGEGGGLNNASGVLAAGTTNDTGVATPRKNIPPRRKKKKLGGPGRKKANPTPIPNDGNGTQISAVAGATGQGAGTDAMEGVTGHDGQDVDASGNTTRNPGYDGNNEDAAEHDDDNDNDNENESGSEAEGSEEGEIDESGGAGSTSAQVTEIPPAITVTTAPTTTTVHTEVTVPITEPTEEVKPIDEAQDVAPTPPAAETITTPTITTTTEPIADPPTITTPLTAIATVADITTIPTTPPAPPKSPSPPAPSPPTPLTNPTVTITDTDPPTDLDTATETATETAIPIPIAIDTEMSNTKDPEETAIIEENAEAITGSGAVNTAITAEKTEGETEKDMAGVEAEEIDFLGGLDAEIDRGISEGA